MLVQWNLSIVVTVKGSHLSIVVTVKGSHLSIVVTVKGSHLSKTASLPGPKWHKHSTKTMQSTSIMQPPLYKGQL